MPGRRPRLRPAQQGGLPRAARVTLEPVLAELHDAGLPPVLALAAAMLAYCEAWCGNSLQAMARVQQGKAAQETARNTSSPDGLLLQLSTVYIAAAQDQAPAQQLICWPWRKGCTRREAL